MGRQEVAHPGHTLRAAASRGPPAESAVRQQQQQQQARQLAAPSVAVQAAASAGDALGRSWAAAAAHGRGGQQEQDLELQQWRPGLATMARCACLAWQQQRMRRLRRRRGHRCGWLAACVALGPCHGTEEASLAVAWQRQRERGAQGLLGRAQGLLGRAHDGPPHMAGRPAGQWRQAGTWATLSSPELKGRGLCEGTAPRMWGAQVPRGHGGQRQVPGGGAGAAAAGIAAPWP